MLYAYCDAHHIETRKCGKLIVATAQTELPAIEAIAKQGLRNGVEGVEFLDGAAARALEPALASVGALHVRETGIIDSHAYLTALAGEIADGPGDVLLRHRMTSGRRVGEGFEIEVETPDGALRVATRRLVLAGGLSTHALAARLSGYDHSRAPPLALAKGSYFSCRRPPAFSRLIYPVPAAGGLGVHLTLDLAGRMRIRARRRMARHRRHRRNRFYRRSGAVAVLLRINSALLAGSARRRPRARLFRRASEALAPRRTGGRLRHRRSAGAWNSRPCGALRDREPRTHSLARAGSLRCPAPELMGLAATDGGWRAAAAIVTARRRQRYKFRGLRAQERLLCIGQRRC